MKKLLHLSHNDIKTDARTLRQIDAAEKEGYEVYGIGLKLDKGLKKTQAVSLDKIVSLRIKSKTLTFLPKALIHLLILFELIPRVLIRAVRLKPDIIHCSDTVMLPVSVMAKIITRSKLVYDAHELESKKNGLTKFRSRVIYITEKLLWPAIDAFLVVSPSIEKWYLEHFKPKRSGVVMNSPDFKMDFGLKNDYLRQTFNIPQDIDVFIYIGIFCPGRGIELLLDVFSNQKVNSSIVFLGYGALEEKIKKQASKCNNIFVHAGVEHENVGKIAASADYGFCLIEPISLSDFYSLPNKFFEYIFSGIPVIASNFPDMAALVNGYSLGYTVSNDKDSIVKIIEEIESLESKFSVGTNLSYLGWEKQGALMLSVYKDVLR